MERLKNAMSYLFGLATLILGALYFGQKRKTERVESELAHEKSTTEITLNEEARKAAKSTADDLLANYERLKRESGDGQGTS